jgi:hypothetical protein
VPSDPAIAGVQFQHVIWTGSRFVATGAALEGGGAFVESPDGITWRLQKTATADALPAAVAASPQGVIAVGSIGSIEAHPASWTSNYGATWTTHPDAFPAPRGSGPTGKARFTVTSVVATDTGWLAVGRQDPVCQTDCGLSPIRALVWTSSDGRKWTAVPDQKSLLGGGMNAVVRFGSGYVAAGVGVRRPFIWTSPDGTTWTLVKDDSLAHSSAATDPALWIEVFGVAAVGGVVVAVGMESAVGNSPPSVRAWWSGDGRLWSNAVGDRFGSGQAFAVASTPEGFVATGPSRAESCLGGIWESADGRAWTCVASAAEFAGFGPYAAAASPSVVVAVGLEGSAPESPLGQPGAVWRKTLR